MDARVGAVGALQRFVEALFVGPRHDTKSFTGMVMDWPYVEQWRVGIERMGPEPDFGLDTEIMVCRKKEIYSETRTWVVRGKVVTASGYKIGTLKRYSPPEAVDRRIVEFAEYCAKIWSPNEAYVMDVAEVAESAQPFGHNYLGEHRDLKIVEVNCLNSAGWYRADMNRLVQALADL